MATGAVTGAGASVNTGARAGAGTNATGWGTGWTLTAPTGIGTGTPLLSTPRTARGPVASLNAPNTISQTTDPATTPTQRQRRRGRFAVGGVGAAPSTGVKVAASGTAVKLVSGSRQTSAQPGQRTFRPWAESGNLRRTLH